MKHLFFKTGKAAILDGAMGTELQREGLPEGACQEMWILENQSILKKIQRQYISAGAQALLVPSFGANKIKLSEFGLSQKTSEINSKLAAITKKTAGGKVPVAGDIGPTGQFIKPFGDLDFETAVEIFKEQGKAGLTKIKYLVGGAVVDRDFADSVGADGCADNAVEAVRVLDSLLKKDLKKG